MSGFPVLLHTAIDARDCRGLAEFYRELLGLQYRAGDEPPSDGSEDDADWLVMVDSDGKRVLTVQDKKDTTPPTWPSEKAYANAHGLQGDVGGGPRTPQTAGRGLGRNSAL